jgi:hypothetical protein
MWGFLFAGYKIEKKSVNRASFTDLRLQDDKEL